VPGVRYRLEVRLTPADIGQRVVIRWRPPGPADSKQMTDVLGILERADDQSFAVRRTRDGQLVVVPRERALAGKVVPPARPRRRQDGPESRPGRVAEGGQAGGRSGGKHG
jgi:N-acetylglutamate synthase